MDMSTKSEHHDNGDVLGHPFIKFSSRNGPSGAPETPKPEFLDYAHRPLIPYDSISVKMTSAQVTSKRIPGNPHWSVDAHWLVSLFSS